MPESAPAHRPINRTRSRIQFILLGLLFFAPFVLAYSAYWLFPDWSPKGRVNYGQLLNPTQSTAALVLTDASGAPAAERLLRDRWTLVQLVGRDCDSACERELILTRQVHTALGAKRERVQRIAIVPQGADIAGLSARYAAEQPDLRWLSDSTDGAAAALFAGPPHAAMLIDPLGTWLMTYPHAADEAAIKRDFKGMQKDINKLLKLSSIG